MGRYSDELARIVDTPNYAIGDDSAQLLREHPHYEDMRAWLSAEYESLYVGWEEQRPDGGYEVRITATNGSSLQSATRPPVIGYQSWYRDTVGEATHRFSEATGIGRTTHQSIVWTETVYP